MSKFDKIFEARESSDDELKQNSPKISVREKNSQDNPEIKSSKANRQAVQQPGKRGNGQSNEPSSNSKTLRSPEQTALEGAVKVDLSAAPAPIDLQPVQRGRPRAKRSDPDYVGFTTYIRRDTHLKVKIALLQERSGQELSELVEELLARWSEKR